MNELTTFTNEEFGSIRTAQIDEEPWFAGKDVALALGYKNPQEAVRKHVDEEDRTVSDSLTVNGTGLTVINESGLYCLILSSKLPGATRFKRWVTGEVLPALRKTGRYEAPQVATQRPLTPDDYLRAAAIIATCKNERLPYALLLIGKAGIDVALLPENAQRRIGNVEHDTETAKLINLACSEYGVSMTAIARATGLHTSQISRIRCGDSFPKPERAAIIRDSIHRLIPELKTE